MVEQEKNENVNPELNQNKYNPADDEQWYQDLINEKTPKSQSIFTFERIVLFVSLGFIILVLIVVAMPIRSGIVVDSKWSEAKTAVCTIKSAVDTYRAKMAGDISRLDVPKGTLAEGFVSGSKLLEKLKLEHVSFKDFQYFDADDFTLEFINDGKDGLYIVKVKATEGGGMSLNGPAGSGSYNSKTSEWTGNLQ